MTKNRANELAYRNFRPGRIPNSVTYSRAEAIADGVLVDLMHQHRHR